MNYRTYNIITKDIKIYKFKLYVNKPIEYILSQNLDKISDIGYK